MRFDDTTPTKEDMEYVESIKEDVAWLMSDPGDPPGKVPWDGPVRYCSGYFDIIYACAVHLIKEVRGLLPFWLNSPRSIRL